MPEIPTFGDAADAARDTFDAADKRGRSLIPWLSTPPDCQDCGAMMYAGVTYDPRQAMRVNSWQCRNGECDALDRHRDDPHTPDPQPPTPGATKLRELLSER